MDYTVIHVTQFLYRGPVHESVMELRLGPRHDSRQEVQSFHLTTNPATTIFHFTDALGNNVHHFDIGPPHQQLDIQTRMTVRTSPTQEAPDQLDPSAWTTLQRLHANGQLWDFFEPSPRVPLSAAVRAFADKCELGRERDPLSCLRRIVAAVYRSLVYAPESTTVDTPIEAVLEAGRGVCQDFAHIALALARTHGIPCRYVSGYLAPASEQPGQQTYASHAWIEAWLPGLEWTAFDPTHDVVAGERHISIAVGRDYRDAAPTRGVFRGGPAGTLSVSVRMEESTGGVSTGEMLLPASPAVSTPAPAVVPHDQ